MKKDRVITGFRPTSDLTVGNYLGAVKPSVELQNSGRIDLYAFVADLHGLTDGDPEEIAPYRQAVVKDLMALGIDPSVTTLYLQSDIEAQTVQIANRVAPYISVSELARTPNLKDKMQDAVRLGKTDSDEADKANFSLFGYPVLMAADIFAQNSFLVGVGQDQEPHLELARTMARRFNARFAPEGEKILVEPRILGMKALRVLSLDGKNKMSKTNPNQAIILTDDPDEARKKIKKATTAGAGEWNDAIESHFGIAEAMTTDEAYQARLRELKLAHKAGQAVMGEFKTAWGDITAEALAAFQAKRAAIDDDTVVSALQYSSDKAGHNASAVLKQMQEAMGF